MLKKNEMERKMAIFAERRREKEDAQKNGK
jgi:hypothetical protein